MITSKIMFQRNSQAMPAAHTIVGVPVHPVGLDALLMWIRETIAREQQASIMYANAYAINLAQRDHAFRDALQQADVVFCDGYGVWLAAQLLAQPLPQRFTPPDWIMRLAALCAQHEYRLFLLGAEPGVAAEAADKFQANFPQLEIGSQHGYFSVHGTENEQIIEQINRAAPDILLVGMGMPRQEVWMQENLHRLSAHVVISVGALFDYLAGRVKRGPRWMTDWGGEWLWRLYSEPHRLWRRYLLGNPLFVAVVLREWMRESIAGQSG
ncbi:MAG: WecB/TagA/CpsF family glycosyltransferase [Ardenticatenaceae bacterium]